MSPELIEASMSGGQRGDYDANWVVDLDTALAVTPAFYDAGGFDCGVAWTNA